jgi:outer membrane protein
MAMLTFLIPTVAAIVALAAPASAVRVASGAPAAAATAAPAATVSGAPPSLAAPVIVTPPPPARGARVLSLDEAVQAALQHQPQLLSARAGTLAAWARADEARAPLLPQITGTAGYQRTTRPGGLPVGVDGMPVKSDSGYNYFSFGVTASQYIWDFGQTTNRWAAAKANANAQGTSERTTRAQVILSVRTAYFAARAQRDLVEVAREALANQERHLRQIDGMVRAGTRPEIDLAQVKTDRANAEAQLITAENGLLTAKAQLMQAMGIDGNADFDVSSDALGAIDGEDSPSDALYNEALKSRPELAVADEQLRAQKLSVSAAKGGYGPTIGASASLSEIGADITNMSFNWNMGVSLSWSLFSGLLTLSQVNEAKANLTAAEAQRETLRQQVRFDVEQSRLAMRAAKSSLHATGEAQVNARERLRLAEGRYSAGVGNIIELGDAQLALTNASAQKTQADFNLALARAQLLRALGRAG